MFSRYLEKRLSEAIGIGMNCALKDGVLCPQKVMARPSRSDYLLSKDNLYIQRALACLSAGLNHCCLVLPAALFPANLSRKSPRM
jgi:hypothetical protein